MSVLLSVSLSAYAFAPKPAGPGESLEPQRLRLEHTEQQGLLLRGEAWRKFAATDGRDWRVRFDEATGAAKWLWGAGIEVPTTSEAALLQTVGGLLERHRELLGFGRSELSPVKANYNSTFDTWYLTFDTLREGLPTYRGGITARVKHGKLVLITAATAPGAPVVGSYDLSAEIAVQIAIDGGPAPTAHHTERFAERQLLEVKDAAGLRLVKTWMVRTRTGAHGSGDPPGIWVTFVDAASGELLNLHNEVRFINGTVTGFHHERTLDGAALIESPMPSMLIEGDTDSDVSDALGNFTVNASANYTADMQGNGVYLEVEDVSGPDAALSDNDAVLQWLASPTVTQAEIDTWVFLHQIQAWGQRVDPTVGMVFNPLVSFVNIADNCNAFFDGNVNFFVAGQGCNNTGEIADVNYHEWGHGFHAWSIQTGFFDSSLSEGASDVVAFLQTADSRIAPFFTTNGGAIRDVGPDRVYPDDYVTNNPYVVHFNGLIFGGAMWDLWDLLQDDLGAAAGTAATEQILAGLLKGGTDIPGTYLEALVADDNDGDLANGTPNQCAILEAFGRHGLGELIGGATFTTSHIPLSIEPDGIPTEVDVEVLATAADCDPVNPADGTVHYRVNNGSWQTIGATVNTSHVIGLIPAQTLGAFVEYYVDGDDTDGNPWVAPASGLYAPYSFFAGDVIEVTCEDFEGSDGGFQHELVSGDIQDGADDWQWGSPAGNSGDPSAAYSGSFAWGNDLGNDNFNGAYQPDKFNRLWSPEVDTLWYTDVFLQYRRWLNIEDGVYDNAIITANGIPVWTNHDSGTANGGQHHQDRQWVSHAVDLGNIGDQTLVELSWELHSDGGLEFGGWTIDDVCIYAPATPDNRLAIVDLVVEDHGGPIGLIWTNPIHAPVERVVVMRRTDRYPTSTTDGDLLIDVTAPVAGQVVEAVHGNADGASGYYAVYGYDGNAWLSWTIEGWNAGFAEPNAGGTSGTGTTGTIDETGTGTNGTPTDIVPEEDGVKPTEPGGCGCDQPTGGAHWLAALGALLVLRRRRV